MRGIVWLKELSPRVQKMLEDGRAAKQAFRIEEC